ncbi:hypothetical protein [Pseudoroseomonas cervicalis]|uniref:cell division protein FtsL n=1 Tax=Teichococcus cervicalis TaxID=204525 RepID=UPI0022F1882E|nr:hypothetical protein [Pseudoroseomonas cervicalis]WBV44218.1 hypothetical protein PFY06_06550 [Pseudoroseomonas cervicalis]
MFRPLTVVAIAAFSLVGWHVYRAEEAATQLDRELRDLNRRIEQARERSQVLRAEWALLNEPERLRQVAQTHLPLDTMTPAQFVRLADLERRLPQAVAFAGPVSLFGSAPTALAAAKPGAGPAQAGQTQAGQTQAGQIQAAPSQAALAAAGAGAAAAAATRLASRAEPARTEPARSEPARAEAARPAPRAAEPARSETARAEPRPEIRPEIRHAAPERAAVALAASRAEAPRRAPAAPASTAAAPAPAATPAPAPVRTATPARPAAPVAAPSPMLAETAPRPQGGLLRTAAHLPLGRAVAAPVAGGSALGMASSGALAPPVPLAVPVAPGAWAR